MEDQAAARDLWGSDATVQRAAARDESAFARLVEAHSRPMARVAYVICGEEELARDAVQGAWGIAWRRLGDLRDPSQVQAWLVAIAANEARQVMRRRRRNPVVEIPVGFEAPAPGDQGDAIAALDLAHALRRLNPDDRALIALRYVAGLDSSEIASHLGLSPSGVRSRLARLLDRLRTELDDD